MVVNYNAAVSSNIYIKCIIQVAFRYLLSNWRGVSE